MVIETNTRIETERLTLRRFTEDDIPAIARLCADREIALNTLSIPHPYTEDDAHKFFERVIAEMSEGKASFFALAAKSNPELVGSISLLRIQPEHRRAELGYTIGVESWGRGYATEACRAVVDHGFRDLELRKIFACFFPRNPASGRVLEKIGFVEEGRLRQHTNKWGKWLDKVIMAQLREEWEQQRGCTS